MESDLNYDIFGGQAKDRNGQAITSFSRLLLRNSGQDCAYSGFRDAYMQRACMELSLDTMASSATLVFINGEFWGVYNIRERYSPEYVSDHTGMGKDTITVIENGNNLSNPDVNTPFVDGSGVAGGADSFNWLLEYAATHDLSVPEHFAYVEAKLDLDSLINLCAARLYLNAGDWPQNNVKLWRNTDPAGTDTRWHFVLLDMDWGMGLNVNTAPGSNDLMYALFHQDCPLTRLLNALMANNSFRDKLIARLWSIPEYLNADRLNALLDEMVEQREPLVALQEARWPKPASGVEFTVEKWREQIRVMRDYIANREQPYRKGLMITFELTEEELDALVETYYPAA